MTVQAQSIDAPRTLGMSRRDLIGILLLLLLGAFFLILGAYSTQPGQQSVFTDEVLGTLMELPSRATLYLIGAFCFFVAGMRLFRSLTSLWALAFFALFAVRPLTLTLVARTALVCRRRLGQDRLARGPERSGDVLR
jgi:cellobiose-specific phosphotransferase system component IIC